MAGISFVNVKLAGSHAGVSIGEDGPSQMALEDLAMIRAVPNCTVLYPWTRVSAERLVVEMATQRRARLHADVAAEDAGHLRATTSSSRSAARKVLRQSDADVATVVGAGVTVLRSAEGARRAAEEGIAIRVIDALLGAADRRRDA